MPDPQRLLNTLRRAVHAFRTTPGRRGRLLHLPADAEVMVAGDLHGNLANFKLFLQEAKLDAHPRRHLIVQELIHGTSFYPAGGDRSHQLLDVLAALKCQYPARVHLLLGNHELAQWRNQLIGKGNITCNNLFRAGIEEAYGDHANDVYGVYLELFAASCVAARTPNRVFISHALPSSRHLQQFDPAILEREAVADVDFKLGGSIHSLLWDRDASQTTVEAFLARVDADLLINGHFACDTGFIRLNERQLVLDAKACPASSCLFSTVHPLSMTELVEGVRIYNREPTT